MIPAQIKDGYKIPVSLLSSTALMKYIENKNPSSIIPDQDSSLDLDEEMQALYSAMTSRSRTKIEVQLSLYQITKDMSKREMEEFRKYRNGRYHGEKFSVSTLYEWRKKYDRFGIQGFIRKRKIDKREPSISEEDFQYFLSLYFIENGPSVAAVRKVVFGNHLKNHPGAKPNDYPSISAFRRLLRSRFKQYEIDFRRLGPSVFKRTHEYYIPRDWTHLSAGQIWTSDHHYLDCLVIRDGKNVRVWATVWRDLRTKKILSVYLHVDAPSSDHVLYSFYLAVKEYGLPETVYLDNGKDYLARTISGIVKHKVYDDQSSLRIRSVFGALHVMVIWATEYNAQAKPIERDFRILIGDFIKFLFGYTGSNSAEKPEALKGDILKGKLLTYDEFEKLVLKYFFEVFNRTISNGNLLKGDCPDSAWEKFRSKIRTVSNDSLAICMMRTSKDLTIGRAGIIDRELGIELRYWNDCFYSYLGERVYLRREVKNYQTAWVFFSKDNSSLCKAEMVNPVAGRASTPIEREALKVEIARKRRSMKEARDATITMPRPEASEIIENLSRAAQADTEIPPKNENLLVEKILTPLDFAKIENDRREAEGKFDLSDLVPPEIAKKRGLFIFESEIEEERSKAG